MDESRKKRPVTDDLFLRKLEPRHEKKLAAMLDIMDGWTEVAARIPKKPNLLFQQEENWESKYNVSHIQGFRQTGNSPTLNLLHDWGTKNITIKHLIQVLRLTGNNAAVTYLQEKVLCVPKTCAPPVSELRNSQHNQQPTEASELSISDDSSASSGTLSHMTFFNNPQPTFSHGHDNSEVQTFPRILDTGCNLNGFSSNISETERALEPHAALPELFHAGSKNYPMVHLRSNSNTGNTTQPTTNIDQGESGARFAHSNSETNDIRRSARQNCPTNDRIGGLVNGASFHSHVRHSDELSMESTELQSDLGCVSLPSLPSLDSFALPDRLGCLGISGDHHASHGSSSTNNQPQISSPAHQIPGQGEGIIITEMATRVQRGWVCAASGGDGADSLQSSDSMNTFAGSLEAVAKNRARDEHPTLPDCAKELKTLTYNFLQSITNNFDARDASKGGNLIGEGGFGHVFLGTYPSGFRIAVKCLKESTEDTWKQLLAEIQTLCSYRHENLVSLLAFSVDGPHKCLIYPYQPNGSLEDRLACRHNSPPLNTDQRMDVIKGTSKGIEFLHSHKLIHRDIKSANILLDEDFSPKVGDFATARMIPTGVTTHMLVTTKIIGTPTYLAPEAYSGSIHIGLDVYSFGVVLLEILTGLPVLDPGREDPDLLTFVQEHCTAESSDEDEDEDDDGHGIPSCDKHAKKKAGTIYDLLDSQAGEWERQTVNLLYTISERCLERRPKRRAKIVDILRWLEAGKVGK